MPTITREIEPTPSGEFEAQVWDKQIEEDIEAGKLDILAEKALADFEANRCTEL